MRQGSGVYNIENGPEYHVQPVLLTCSSLLIGGWCRVNGAKTRCTVTASTLTLMAPATRETFNKAKSTAMAATSMLTTATMMVSFVGVSGREMESS